MNDKLINELMWKAGAKFEMMNWVHYENFSYEKFAELIVKECIDACYKANEIRNIVPPSQDQVVRWCLEEIERKFGVR